MPKPLTKKQSAILQYLYYDKKFYFGRDKIFKYLQEHYPEAKISRRQVMHWLKDNELAQLYKPTRKTKNIQATILSRPYQQLAIDLIDMQHYENQGFKYILTCIDLFSKKAWARAMKTKKASTVASSMHSIIKAIQQPITTIRSDNGSELIAVPFKNILKKYNIKQVLSDPSKPQSNGGIERFNATIKRLIKMYITQSDDHKWKKVLPELLDNYNSSVHRITKNTPNDLAEDKTLFKQAKSNITKASLPHNDKSQVEPIFKVGDQVRLKLQTDDKYKKSYNWSKYIYTIYKVHKPRKPFSKIYYFVKDDEREYRSKLYNNDLQLIKDVKNPVKEPQQFIISKLLNRVRVGKKWFYSVKWKNYKEPTLEPEENLLIDVPKMVAEYKRKH